MRVAFHILFHGQGVFSQLAQMRSDLPTFPDDFEAGSLPKLFHRSTPSFMFIRQLLQKYAEGNWIFGSRENVLRYNKREIGIGVKRMRKMEEKTISSETIFSGKVVQLKVDEVQLPDGRTTKREIVNHPGAVAVLAITDEDRLVLVRQYRKPLEKTILEIPAGKLEAGEELAACAARELEEETGYRAKALSHLVSFYTSPGFADELLHLFKADGLDQGQVNLDQDEFVELVELTLEECMEHIRQGDIIDAKTIMAVYLWQNEVLSRR